MNIEELRLKREAVELQILAKNYIEKKAIQEHIKLALLSIYNTIALDKKLCARIKTIEEVLLKKV